MNASSDAIFERERVKHELPKPPRTEAIMVSATLDLRFKAIIKHLACDKLHFISIKSNRSGLFDFN